MSFPSQNAIEHNTSFEMWWKLYCNRNANFKSNRNVPVMYVHAEQTQYPVKT